MLTNGLNTEEDLKNKRIFINTEFALKKFKKRKLKVKPFNYFKYHLLNFTICPQNTDLLLLNSEY